MNNSKSYVPTSMVTGVGWKARITRAKAKIDKARDPHTLLVRRIRQYSASMDGAEKRAREEYETEHAPVASLVPQTVHPQVQVLLERFLTDHGLVGRDLTLPLAETGETLEAKIGRYREDAEAEHQRAVADLNAADRDIALAKVRAAQAHLATIEDRHVAHGVAALYGALAVHEPANIPVDDSPKRRGRPPKVHISSNEPVLPE